MKTHKSGHKAGQVQIGRAIRGLLKIRRKGTRYMQLATLQRTVAKLVQQPQAL